MINLEEVHELILGGIDATDKTLKASDLDKDTVDNFTKYMKELVFHLSSVAQMQQQTLAYIISDFYDGEFVMTEREIYSEIEGYNFFIDILVHDDNSVVISARREKQCESE